MLSSISRRVLTRPIVAVTRTIISSSSPSSTSSSVCPSCRFHSSSSSLSDSTATASASSSAAESDWVQPNWKYRETPEWAEPAKPKLISLDDLQPNEGAVKKAKRYGRGPGSGLGKTCGKGHKGQGQRKGLRKRGFEGGQTPFWRRTPKLAVNNAERYWKMLEPLTINRIVEFIKAGRIDGSQLITMRTLYDSGCVPSIEHGVKLLSGGLRDLDRPLHLQLSDCSAESRSVIEAAGGSVHLVWFNRMTLRAHLNPVSFLRKYGRLPKHTGVPPPKKAAKYGFVVEHCEY